MCVNLRRFLSVKAAAISSSFSKCFLSFFSLCKVSWMPLIEVVTLFVNFVTFFQGTYGLSKVMSSSSNSR